MTGRSQGPVPDTGTEKDAGSDDAGVPAAGGNEPDAGPEDGGEPGAGEPESDAGTSCEPSATELLDNGEWDPHFSIAGVSSMDGHVPHIYDLDKAPSGGLLATGYIRWFGTQASTPLIRRQIGQWKPEPRTWAQETPGGAGFSAVAVKNDTMLALATNDVSGERSSEV
ncbi:hypothetical protein BHS05_12200 [Myxococcus xanthus]|uniref:Uncharacterized protein n=1 Tax=Myxococcus xanthus TaxID=34 RepID=A0AAE6FYJ2_MYXXA|nr:hypothetical protein BHS09_12250 [Myxococcus xanthus]QDE74970.1 hypothetical protein BHS08_12265 [Myxococcus xanthus]QDE96542.1 hypothetical protein BHS05_12200 [Myxococcus xanthus]